MKKVLSLLMLSAFIFGITSGAVMAKSNNQTTKGQKVKKQRIKKDVLKNDEYKELKLKYFQAEGYGDTYNCKVEQQKFCKVKDYDSGIYVLCDRDVSRTQWESAKIFFRYGRCVKMN